MLLEDLFPFAIWAVTAWLAAAIFLRRGASFDLATQGARLRMEFAFLAVVTVGLLACRYPVLVYPHELNIDESECVAVAHGYTRSLIPFSQDAHTCGPLNYYDLMWPAALGLPITYFTIRLTGFVFILGTLFYVRRSVALVAGNRISYLITLPLISFYFFAYENGFVHFSSEHFPDLLLAISIWLIAKYWRLGRSHFFLLGALLGTTPFTKLQSSPLAVYLFVVVTVLLLLRARGGTDKLWRGRLVALLLGGALMPLIIAVPLIAVGRLHDGIYRYIIIPSHYGAGIMTPELIPLPQLVRTLLLDGPQFTVYFFALLAVAAAGLVFVARTRLPGEARTWLIGLALSAVYLGLTIFAVLKPDLPYAHYLMLLPQPVLYVVAWVFRGVRTAGAPEAARARSRIIVGAFVAVSFCALPTYLFMQAKLPHIHDPAYATQPLVDPVSAYIKTVTTSDDLMANWGYSTKYYVEANVAPGVRDFATLYEIFPAGTYDYYRNCFLDDLKTNKPKVFVDSVGENYLATWPHPIERARATTWPELADYLAQNYQPPVEIYPSPNRPAVLVYVRK